MDSLNHYRQIIRAVITDYANLRYAHGEVERVVVFDDDHDRYLLMIEGWEDSYTRVHGCLIHVEIRNGKIWIQRDGTEDGIAPDLVAAGVPKDHIVLGFRSEEARQYTEYAAA